MFYLTCWLSAWSVSAALVPPADRADLVVADFEGTDWAGWRAEGTAFGTRPALGTLPGQMAVTGYAGKGLANSFVGGDTAVGTLTSPAFKVERKCLNFLIGGGKYPGETCFDLLLDDKVVRTATGPNDENGGTEELEAASWDVAEFAGRTVVLRAVDRRTGGWGHVTVDHVVQSDRPATTAAVTRDIVISTRYLHLPVRTGAKKRLVEFVAGGAVVRAFDIEWADGEPSFYAFADVSDFQGKTLTVRGKLPGGPTALAAVVASDALPGADTLYAEKHRPQFHFTSRRGWLNDPNGLVYHKGEWHLYYQHNPFGWEWGNMHWGHAVSKDLVRWEELPLAVYPKRHGDWAFSGSAVVDRGNTSGFGTAADGPLIAAYTSTGRGECILSSTDRGRTWKEFAGNPVVKHVGRDPRLLWHAASKQWVMAVYTEADKKQWIAFHTSPDLKVWTYRSRVENFFECPDLYELPIDGNPSKTQWVLSGADGEYLLGDFDGTTFKTASGKHKLWHGDFYAAQTFSDAPAGRRVQIGWARGVTFPGAAFNQQMSVPVELTLRTTPAGPRLFAEPVEELKSLRGPKQSWAGVVLPPGGAPGVTATGELFDIVADIEVGTATVVGVTVRGVAVEYDVVKRLLTCSGKSAPLEVTDGRLRLRVLADRGSVEVFAAGGGVALSAGVLLADGPRTAAPFARGGTAKLLSFDAYEMSSAWPKPR